MDWSVGAAVLVCALTLALLIHLRLRATRPPDKPSSKKKRTHNSAGRGLGEMEWLTINAMKSAFAPFDERIRIINEVVKPGYARLRADEVRVVAAG